jgi:hypothetical protein
LGPVREHSARSCVRSAMSGVGRDSSVFCTLRDPLIPVSTRQWKNKEESQWKCSMVRSQSFPAKNSQVGTRGSMHGGAPGGFRCAGGDVETDPRDLGSPGDAYGELHAGVVRGLRHREGFYRSRHLGQRIQQMVHWPNRRSHRCRRGRPSRQPEARRANRLDGITSTGGSDFRFASVVV